MNHFKGRHFQKDIILVAVGYYFRFSLSYRDIVELLRDRGHRWPRVGGYPG